MVFTMGASIRVIKLVRGQFGKEAYTLEFECEALEAKDLLKELTSSAYGQRLLQLLNESKFLPEVRSKTEEEIRIEAEEEAKRIKEREESLKNIGRRQARSNLFEELRKYYGTDFVRKFKQAMVDGEVKEEQKKEPPKELPDHSRTHL